MRLPEEKVKQAILDPDAEVRERAVRYFSDSFSEDATVVPLVIEAVERYGREGAYHLVGSCTQLVHTEESISWVVDELDREDADQYENYTFNLTRVLCHADPALLVHRDSQIIESRHFFAGLRDSFLERIEMLSWDDATCWRELEAVCAEGKDKQYSNEVDLDRARHILEALARSGSQCENKVHSVLSQEIVSFENNPMKWMEPLMVELAGWTRLASAVPLIIQRLHEEDDLLPGLCEEALVRIGNDSVVAAVIGEFRDAERQFRLYATGVVEKIRSDLAVEKCLALFVLEKDRMIKRDLAHAALFFANVAWNECVGLDHPREGYRSAWETIEAENPALWNEFKSSDIDGMIDELVEEGVDKFAYVYDMGDNWEHVIKIEKTLPAEAGVRYPRCIAGKRACPPEDCGGTWGYEDFRAAIRDQNHENHEDMLEWVGGAFDPERFDLEQVNGALKEVRR